MKRTTPARSAQTIESLESRRLLAADPGSLLAQGFEPVQWEGRTVYARPEQWVARVDGLSGLARKQLARVNTALENSAGPGKVEVQLTDALKIEPAVMTLPAGVPVTFVVTNTGVTDHEFYLGDEAAQAEHEQEMMEMGGMAHDEEMGIAVEPGATKELAVTFPEAGSILAGCHVAGHYAGGMKATVKIGS